MCVLGVLPQIVMSCCSCRQLADLSDWVDPMIETIEILNGIPHAVAILDRRLRITAMNRALEAQCGHSSSEARGIPVQFILRATVGAKELQAAAEDGRVLSCRGDIVNSVRKKIPMRFTATPLRGGDEQVHGMIVVLEDISLLCAFDKKNSDRNPAGAIVGHSPGMQEVFELLPVLSATDATVLITGETGTGKDLLAETIHQASKRSRRPFVKVNCGAIPEALLESELFGHKRGAFTGAHSDKPGMFQLAQGGTIFLTEIGDLPLQLQVKLLSVLDDREFYPLGASRKTSVDVRIITGTHRDLRRLVREGKFREDLFFRLNVLRAHLPPLRQRESDIRLLLDYFLQNLTPSARKDIKGFTKSAYARLESYSYPGNVRELRNIVEFGVSMCPGNRIDTVHLPPYVISPEQGEAAPRGKATSSKNDSALSHRIDFPDNDESATGATWAEIEKKKIIAALLKTNGNRSKASLELGCGRSTLWRKIKLHGIG